MIGVKICKYSELGRIMNVLDGWIRFQNIYIGRNKQNLTRTILSGINLNLRSCSNKIKQNLPLYKNQKLPNDQTRNHRIKKVPFAAAQVKS